MEKMIRILMNEDDNDQVALNEHELRQKGISFTSKQVSTREEFLRALEEFKPDVILTDYRLPVFDAPAVLRLVQERELIIPVIIVTGSIDEEAAAGTIMAGAADYVLKQRLAKLAPAVEGALARARVLREKVQAEKELRRREYEFRSLVETSPNIIARYDRELRYIYVNPTIEQITGIPRSSFIGKTNRELGMNEETASELESIFQKAFSTGHEITTEYSLPGSFGKRYFLLRVVPEYFTKEGVPESLLSISQDITIRKTAEEHAKFVSFHDSLTGLYNRLFFEEELNRIDRGRELPLSIIMCDVNFLKLANDMFSHEAGDQLLIKITNVLKTVSRDGDVIARWGGDEFTLLLPKTDYEAAVKIAGRIGKSCSETRGTILPPSVALGVATKKNEEENIYRVLREAEKAMYENKMIESKKNVQNMVAAILGKIEEKDGRVQEHIHRLKDTIMRLGKDMRLSDEQIKELIILSEFHEMGKIAVPESILTKREELTPEERDIIKKIPEVGYRIAKSLSEVTPTAEAVLSVRERWDGKGYPKGQGQGIPLLARVFAILDAYDTMTHERPYAKTLTQTEAMEELKRNAGKQFDPELVEKFLILLNRKEKAII